MYKYRKYTGILTFIVVVSVLLFTGIGVGQERATSALVGSADIREVREEAERAHLQMLLYFDERDFAAMSKLSSALIKKYEEIEDASIQKCVVEAMFRLAGSKEQEDDHRGAVKIYEKIDKKYGKEKDIEFQRWVAESLYSEALAYSHHLNDYKKAIKYFERVRKDYGQSEDDEIRATVAFAMYQEGIAHRAQGNLKLAEKCFKEVIRKFGKGDSVIGPVINSQKELDQLEKKKP